MFFYFSPSLGGFKLPFRSDSGKYFLPFPVFLLKNKRIYAIIFVSRGVRPVSGGLIFSKEKKHYVKNSCRSRYAKRFYRRRSRFSRGSFDSTLRKRRYRGLCTDICVISNAMVVKAFFPEIPLTVDAKGCAGVSPESHKRALEAMKVCQIRVINE